MSSEIDDACRETMYLHDVGSDRYSIPCQVFYAIVINITVYREKRTKTTRRNEKQQQFVSCRENDIVISIHSIKG
jgi:hypothetical protein